MAAYHEIKPFGEVSFERERDALGDSYSDFFFRHVDFNRTALEPDRYLIIGRRGGWEINISELLHVSRQNVPGILY